MLRLREIVPEGFKQYVRLMQAKLRYPDCFIGSSVPAGVRLGRGCSISRDAEVNRGVEVGDYSYLNRGAMVGSGTIGRFCSIGPYAMIGLPEHPLDYLSTSPLWYGRANLLGAASRWEDYGAPPRIGSDVWIGALAVVRQGVSIGHGAVVGAGAIVTRDVEPYQIVAGVPAKPIRSRFDRDTVERLLGSRWWDQDPSECRRMAERFLRPRAEWALPEAPEAKLR